jgi:hypothetical protein
MSCEPTAQPTAVRASRQSYVAHAGTRSSQPSLLSSLWHCSRCNHRVRVYSTREQVDAGQVENRCPTCQEEMKPLKARAGSVLKSGGASSVLAA